MLSIRNVTLFGIIAAAAFSRVMPHPPNFTPILALGLFGGARFADRRLAFLIPLAAMACSDLFIGYHNLLPLIYALVALSSLLGLWLRKHRGPAAMVGASVFAAAVFFLVSNGMVWLTSGMYAGTPAGLLTCYTSALPFFQNMVAGTLAYGAALFGAFAVLERGFPSLRESAVTVAHA